MENMKKTPVIKREWAMPNKNTFDIKPIKKLIKINSNNNHPYLNFIYSYVK